VQPDADRAQVRGRRQVKVVVVEHVRERRPPPGLRQPTEQVCERVRLRREHDRDRVEQRAPRERQVFL
jgi:hypothetical protein